MKKIEVLEVEGLLDINPKKINIIDFSGRVLYFAVMDVDYSEAIKAEYYSSVSDSFRVKKFDLFKRGGVSMKTFKNLNDLIEIMIKSYEIGAEAKIEVFSYLFFKLTKYEASKRFRDEEKAFSKGL